MVRIRTNGRFPKASRLDLNILGDFSLSTRAGSRTTKNGMRTEIIIIKPKMAPMAIKPDVRLPNDDMMGIAAPAPRSVATTANMDLYPVRDVLSL